MAHFELNRSTDRLNLQECVRILMKLEKCNSFRSRECILIFSDIYLYTNIALFVRDRTLEKKTKELKNIKIFRNNISKQLIQYHSQRKCHPYLISLSLGKESCITSLDPWIIMIEENVIYTEDIR